MEGLVRVRRLTTCTQLDVTTGDGLYRILARRFPG
jgi:hypothetical protein